MLFLLRQVNMSAVKGPIRLSGVWSHYCDQKPCGPEKRSSFSSSRCVLPRILAADPLQGLQVLTECWKGALGGRRINSWSAIHAKNNPKIPTLMGKRRFVESVGSSSSVCRCVLVAVKVCLMSLRTFFTGGNVLHCHFTEVCSSHTHTHTHLSTVKLMLAG